MNNVKTPAQIAAMFGCTIEQAKSQLLANAKQMMSMAAKAEKTGQHRGMTHAQLVERANAFMQAAA